MARVFRIVLRTIVWLLLAWVLVRGVVSFLPPPAAERATAAPAPVQAEPADDSVRTFALLFSQEYLTWRAADSGDHAARLKPYLAPGLDEQAGWRGGSGVRDQTALGAWVFDDQKLSASRRLVTVAVRVSLAATDAKAPPTGRVLYLAVPVSFSGGNMAVDALPALVSGPGLVLPAASLYGDSVADPPAEIRTLAEGFLRAYVGGSDPELAYFVAPGTHLASLKGGLQWGGIDDLRVFKDQAGILAVVTGTLRDPVSGASLQQSWTLRLEQRERWYVKDLLQKGAANP